MENDNTMYWRWGVGIVVAVVIIIGAVMLIKGSQSPSRMGTDMGTSTSDSMASDTVNGTETSSVTPTGVSETARPSMTASGESITVADQAEGSAVDVSAMSLTKASWIAIKDTKGWILGAGWFPAGATSGTVPLVRNTQKGLQYEAVVYVDDGDKAFDMHKDMLVSNTDGTLVNAMFMAK